MTSSCACNPPHRTGSMNGFGLMLLPRATVACRLAGADENGLVNEPRMPLEPKPEEPRRAKREVGS